MSDDRFDDLMSQMLDDELSASQTQELVELLRDQPDRQRDLQEHLEIAEVLFQSEDHLRSSSLFLAAVDSRISGDPLTTRFQSEPFEEEKRWQEMLGQAGSKAAQEEFLEDFVWGLFVSEEFTTNH